MSRPNFVLGAPQRELLRPSNRLEPPTSQGQESASPVRHDTELPEVG
jgi:hypothetical protein